MWRKTLERWLTAEERGRLEEVEEALALLFRALPRLAPPGGFADRVMARAGLVAAPVWAASPVLRIAVAVALAATGLFAPLVVGALGIVSVTDVLAALRPARILAALAGLLGGLVDWMIGGLSVWQGLTKVGQTVALIVATPTMTVALLICALISVLAFRVLQDLLVRERSWTHA